MGQIPHSDKDGGNEVLQEFRERISIRNIRQNLLLIVSSFAFLGLNLQRDPQKIIAIAVALPVSSCSLPGCPM